MMIVKQMNKKLRNFRIVHFLFFMVVITIGANSQSVSPYSRYGLGNFQQRGSERSRIMGGAGVAVQDKYDVNNINPSALASMDTTSVIIDLGFHVTGTKFSTEKEDEKAYTGNLDYFTIVIPFKSWWFFSGSLQPLTSVGYDISKTSTYDGKENESTLTYTTNYEGNGGINLISATNCFKLPLGFSLGAEVGFLWGNHDETITESYSGMDMSTSKRETTSFHRGLWLSTGLQYEHVIDKLSFIVGGTYDVPTTIVSDNESSIKTSWETIEDETGRTVTHNMPAGFGAGLSISYANKLTIAGDYKIKKWSNTSFGVDPERLCDNNIFSLGGEYIPDYNSIKYLKRVAYRVGLHYETGSYKVKCDPVESAYVSLGLGLPGRLRSRLSFGLEFGTIGGFNSKHLTETYGQVNIGISLGEVWFVKTKFD